ncbi:ATPase [Myxozyma melibiosi]|uniref:Peroxisomal ATPase PEX6 n=1 Tax=Myxozyma melibiosi TaxID=54550 RepID=A0ABR1FDZ2_9ASCO
MTAPSTSFSPDTDRAVAVRHHATNGVHAGTNRGGRRSVHRSRPTRPRRATLRLFDALESETVESTGEELEIIGLSDDLFDELIRKKHKGYSRTNGTGLPNGNDLAETISKLAVKTSEELPEPCNTVSICPASELALSLSPKWTMYRCERRSSLPPSTASLTAVNFTGLEDHMQLLIQPVEPLRLESVILVFPKPAYDYISSIPESEVLNYLRPYKLLRKGQHLQTLDCNVKACEPVDQGLVEKGITRITFVCDKTSSSQDNRITDSSNLSNGTSKTNGANGWSSDEEEYGLNQYIDSQKIWERSPNTALTLAPKLVEKAQKPVALYARPLDMMISSEFLTPIGKEYDDGESRGFVDIEVLAKLGVFSGSWVYVCTNSTKRPIRLYSFPLSQKYDPHSIYLSPILLYNIKSPEAIELQVSSSVSRIEPRAAREITIARVNSYASTERVYENAFMRGLRAFFERYRRVVVKGDLIAVPIDEVLARLMSGSGADSTSNSLGIEDLQGMPGSNPSTLVWFKITAVVPPDEPQSDDSKSEEYAFCVDSSQTRVAQMGSIQAPLPPTDKFDWSSYFRIPPLPRIDSPSSERLRQLLQVSIKSSVVRSRLLVYSLKPRVGKTTMIKSICSQLGIHVYQIEANDVIGETDTKTLASFEAKLDRARNCSPCVVLISHLEAIAKKPAEGSGTMNSISGKILAALDRIMIESTGLAIIATVTEADSLADDVRGGFNFEIQMETPSESERHAIFQYLLSPFTLALGDTGSGSFTADTGSEFSGMITVREDVSIAGLALQSAGLVPQDLLAIVKSAKSHALDRLEKEAKELASANEDVQVRDIVLASSGYVQLTPSDFEQATSDARRKYSDSIGAPRIPSVKWEDVGGLADVKNEILDTIEMPLKYPDLFAGGVKKRSGILFYGPPGTGKTLLAKAIATTFSLNFFSVKGPELLNMYIGESESNVRKVFQRARDAKPCVVFFDELDSVAPKRGNQGDSGGVMDRIVSQLLAELDGMSSNGGEGVFVVGATNRPDLLDEALLRPGRFDKMVYLGVSDTHEKQLNILKALTRKFKLAPDLDLEQVTQTCPFTYTGADFYALCSDAMLNAMTRLARTIDEKVSKFKPEVNLQWWFDTQATKEDIEVVVGLEDFEKARRELVASVSEDELRHYLRVRENFEGGKVAAATGADAKAPESESANGGFVGKGKGKGKGKAKAIDF